MTTTDQWALMPPIPVPEAAVEVGIEDHLVVVVEDTPVGQGSKKKVGRGIFIDDNADKLKPWREAVKTAARVAMREMHGLDCPQPLFGRGVAVRLSAVYTFARPASHYGTGRNADALKATAPAEHAGTPDLDKLLRSTLDSFTAAGVWDDDRQVSRFADVARVYPGGHRDALRIPGAVIRVRAL